MNWCRKSLKQLLALLLVAVLGWSLAGCNQPLAGSGTATTSKASRSKLTEVSPPLAIQTLKQALEVYQPQVKILSPRPNQVIEDTEVEVRLQVQDLPLFQDEVLELGPYIQVLLDNQPYAQVHDLNQPLSIAPLTPGTHTIRAFAVRPWHESFKNEAAFAQTTFHVFTQTAENQPIPTQPLLTYNYPQGIYGAEPVLLDFYLTNAPLHLVAREDAEDEIPDWQIRCTINGESFSFDRWEPIYLKGLKPGKNWVKLELLDDRDQPIANAFNNTVQIVTYEPGGTDTLAQLTRGELTADAARKIVDPNYVPPAEPEPEPEPEPEIELAPEPEIAPEPEVILEPDFTQDPSSEAMPPEIIAPGAAPTVGTPGAIEPEETTQQVEPASIQPEATIPSVPSADVAEEKPETKKGLASPVTAPVIEAPAFSSQPETDRSMEESLEALEDELEKVFQAPIPSQPEPVQLDQTVAPEPLFEQPLSSESMIVPDGVEPNSAELNGDTPISALDLSFPAEESFPAPTAQPDEITPNLVGVFDRVKDFFEGLRKQPRANNLPFLSPLDSQSTESSAVESTRDQVEQMIEELLGDPSES